MIICYINGSGKMKTRYIKICSIFLVVIMTICSLPINAFSIESTDDESQRNILGEVGGYLAVTLKTQAKKSRS